MNRLPKSLLFLTLLCSLFLLSSCQEEKTETAFSDCRYDQPEAVFVVPNRLIESQQFSLNGQKGVEMVRFSDGVQLKLTQEGCDDLRQIFEFTFPGLVVEEDVPQFWLMLAVAQFDRIADISPDFMVFGSWAAALVRYQDQFVFGESLQLQKGFYAKIERTKSRQGGILMLTLSQKP